MPFNKEVGRTRRHFIAMLILIRLKIPDGLVTACNNCALGFCSSLYWYFNISCSCISEQLVIECRIHEKTNLIERCDGLEVSFSLYLIQILCLLFSVDQPTGLRIRKHDSSPSKNLLLTQGKQPDFSFLFYKSEVCMYVKDL